MSDVYLAHYGVKGMRWGKRKAADSGDAGPSRRDQKKALKELDKQSLAKDKAKAKEDWDKNKSEVVAARDRMKNNARSEWKTAKAQYKVDKTTIGKREARKKLAEVQERQMKDYEKSQEIISGKEAAVAIIATVGASVLYSALAAAANG